MFEVFDHTADLGLRVHAATLEELFADAARGLNSIIVANLDDVRLVELQNIEVQGQDREYLLFDWLTEVLFLFDSQKLLLAEFEVRFTETGLKGLGRGERFDLQRHHLEHEIKAITYHGLKVVPARGGWLAEVIVDI